MYVLRNLLYGTVMALGMGLGGCVAMPDGTSQPDYVLIEFGAVAAFTVIVNETEASNDAVLRAYSGLSNLEVLLNNGGELNLSILDEALSNAVPTEYKAIAYTGSKLIRSRVRKYMAVKVPENPITENEMVVNATLAIVHGAKSALQPRYDMIMK